MTLRQTMVFTRYVSAWLRRHKSSTIRAFLRLTELESVPPNVAWMLVGSLFRQTTSMIAGASVFAILGIVGFIGTGSPWYLGGLAYTVCVFAWRFWQTRVYAHARDTATPVEWAWRSLRSGWATALGWGAWSTVVLFEPEKSVVIMVIGMHAGLVAGGAVRNSAVRAVASGQVILAAVPLFLVCAASGNIYLRVYSGIVAMHLFAAMALIRFLHNQTVRLLLSEKTKSDLVDRLEAANQELETLVATDALTSVANRRAFDLTAAREWRRSAREQTPLSMLMIDVDHFKAFNDFYGHQAGDTCLQELAATINTAIRRPPDLLARYGGEEFVVLLPGTYLEGAVHVGEKILAALGVRNMTHNASTWGHVTVSIGAACMAANLKGCAEQLTGLADSALYTAKRRGRNRVHAAEAQALEHLTNATVSNRTELTTASSLRNASLDNKALGPIASA